MKTMKKINYTPILKISTLVVLSIVLIFGVWQEDVQSRTKTYYSGEAVSFNNNLVFATTNTGALELFTLENNEIVRTAMFKPRFVRLPKGSENYHDLSFDVNNGSLYLYLINGRYLYKYDVSNPYAPRLMEKIKDNAWDWFMQLDKTDDYLVTIGTKEIKYWNKNLQVVKSFKVDHQKPENVSCSPKGDYIFSINDNVVEVYDTNERYVTANIQIVAKEAGSLRGLSYDSVHGEIYIADDEALKVFNLEGRELRRFKHTSDYAYDVESSNVNNSIYFSDGIGIVRNDKNNLKAIDWQYTTDIGGKNGWAMDIEVVSDSSGDKLVVFNNKEILVLADDLELIDYFQASEIDEAPIEGLYLQTSQNNGLTGDYVTVSGGGFAMNEDIIVKMGKDKWSTRTDANGRFKRTITVIDTKPQTTDIKVDGLQSKLSYSISFKIN